MKILILEDNERLANLIVEALEQKKIPRRSFQ